MAPEQTLGVANASPASDQYSLAAVLYEAICGRPPFSGEVAVALLERIRTFDVTPPRRIDVALPVAFEAVVLRAMSRAPDARFPSVADLGAALLPFADAATQEAFARDFGDRPGAAPGSARSSARVATATASPAADRTAPRKARSSIATKWDTPLPCAPGESPFHIKGMPYRGLLRFIESAIPGGLEAFCASLPDPRLRDFLHQPFLATGRYDVLPFVPLSATLAGLLGLPADELVREAARRQCRYDAKTVFQRMFSDREPDAIAACFSRFNAQYYDFGTYRGTVVAPDRIVLEIENVPTYLFVWQGPMHLAYAEEVARISGASDAAGTLGTMRPSGRAGPHPLVASRSELVWS
jgi:hypothetical protein